MIKIILQIRMRSQSADRRSDGPAKMEFLVRWVDGGDDGDGGEDRCDGDDDEDRCDGDDDEYIAMYSSSSPMHWLHWLYDNIGDYDDKRRSDKDGVSS